jgi:hypothetical protein
MYCQRWIVLTAILAAVAAGCGKSEGTGGVDASAGGKSAGSVIGGSLQATSGLNAASDGPTAAVTEFLHAIKTGNDARATQMLSAMARQKTSALNRSVSPPASDTAKFEVGKVDYKAEDLAGVHCTWTDLDEKGEPQTDEAMWMVRREPQGWRIAGVAATVFPGEPPLLLNFEEPEDMLQKQQQVKQEIQRRAQEAELQAKAQTAAPAAIRR